MIIETFCTCYTFNIIQHQNYELITYLIMESKIIELTSRIKNVKKRLNELESIDTEDASVEYEKKIIEKLQLIKERELIFKQYLKKINVKYTDQQRTQEIWRNIYAKCE